MFARFALLSCGLLALVFGGCARFPDESDGARAKRLVISITLAGEARLGIGSDVRDPYYYFFLIRNEGDPSGQTGPLPVIQPPWGNGYAAGRYTHMVTLGPFQAQPLGQYLLYRFDDPGTQVQAVLLGTPVAFTAPATGDTILRFEIDLAQISATPADAARITHLQVNIIATDYLPSNPDEPSDSKRWDALGSGAGDINRFLNLAVTQDSTYDNSYFGNIEPRGDVADPSLDIVDFSIEVRS